MVYPPFEIVPGIGQKWEYTPICHSVSPRSGFVQQRAWQVEKTTDEKPEWPSVKQRMSHTPPKIPSVTDAKAMAFFLVFILSL
jgi:hypothetical protein